MEKYTYDGEDFKAVFTTDKWKIGLLKYSDRFSSFKVMERHLKTDEIFVLLEGNAKLFLLITKSVFLKTVNYSADFKHRIICVISDI